MVTVELEFEEQELVDLLMEEFTRRYSFDDITIALMKQYFTDIVNDGSCSLFYGPNRLENYVMSTWDSCTVETPHSDDYDGIVAAWEGDKEYKNGIVVAHLKDAYLVQWQ